jgi:hypothetical protein
MGKKLRTNSKSIASISRALTDEIVPNFANLEEALTEQPSMEIEDSNERDNEETSSDDDQDEFQDDVTESADEENVDIEVGDGPGG